MQFPVSSILAIAMTHLPYGKATLVIRDPTQTPESVSFRGYKMIKIFINEPDRVEYVSQLCTKVFRALSKKSRAIQNPRRKGKTSQEITG